MTPDEEYAFSRRNCWSRRGGRRTLLTGRFPLGSALPSSTSRTGPR